MAGEIILVRKFKRGKGSKYRPGAVAQEIRKQVAAEGRKILRDMRKTTSTWEGDKPKFQQRQQVAPSRQDEVILTVRPREDGSWGTRKWHYLNEGTSVRYYRMSRDFRRKTFPNSLKIARGKRGYPHYAGGQQLPGIEARNWSILIQQKRRKEFVNNIRNAFRRGIRNAGI